MKSLELFSGTGGLAKGLELAGFQHAAFVEFNKHACNSLRKNFDPETVFFGDVRDFDFSKLSNIDLVAGGPPCQPFSLGGLHKASEDNRDMFPYAAKAVSLCKPKAFLFENVKGLLRQSFRPYFTYVLLRLSFPDLYAAENESWQHHFSRLQQIDWESYSGTKYRVKFALLNSADYGVPQVRERVFIVGMKSDLNIGWEFPKTTHSSDQLYLNQFINHSYWQKHQLKVPQRYIGSGPIHCEQFNFGLPMPGAKLPWQTVRDALEGVPDPQTNHALPDHIFRSGARSYAGHTGSFIDLPAKTIKAGAHGVPGGENMIRFEDGSIRYLTVHEGKLLQTFDSDFVVTGGWGEGFRQIGNAVPTKLAEILGTEIHNLLCKSENRTYSLNQKFAHLRAFNSVRHNNRTGHHDFVVEAHEQITEIG